MAHAKATTPTARRPLLRRKRVVLALAVLLLIGLWSLWADTRGERHHRIAGGDAVFTQVVIASHQPRQLAAFYTQVFGAQQEAAQGEVPAPLNPRAAPVVRLRTPLL